MSMTKPYISIVACGRNDNHGGELLSRMQMFVDCLREQSLAFGCALELVLVEWNPPAKEKKLPRVLDLHANPFFSARVIEIPCAVHKRLRFSRQLHLFQMIAKNYGIRRAQGEFICATNVDIIFSEGLMQWLSRRLLRPGLLYRVDRHDVSRGMREGICWKEKLDYCRNHVIRVNARDWTEDRLHNRVYRIHSGTPEAGGMPFLHTNACGDFQLMHKNHWYRLRGYPELEIFSLHLDSIFAYSAHFLGIKEEILPFPVYHVEHDSGWKPKVDKSYTRRFAALRTLNYAEVQVLAEKMLKDGKPIVFNRADWGGAALRLRETQVSA